MIVEQNAATLNRLHEWVFVLDISDSLISVRSKPNLYSDEQMVDGTIPFIGRMRHYLHFLSEVMCVHSVLGDWTMIVDVSDGGLKDGVVPQFGFQKSSESNNVLLPDPEFFYMRWYEGDEFLDYTAFDEKVGKAIFVGSTTGGGLLDLDAVRSRSLPRLKSALTFQDSEWVDFRLPNVVQCQSDSVRDEILALGFGVGHANWQEQLRYKYLLSMDGNGAACSRLALSLKSNSIPLKYHSHSQLFYFHGMQPWLHFIPIDCDQQVVDFVLAQNMHHDRHAFIAEQSSAFFRCFLNKSAVMDYTGYLLQLYVDWLKGTVVA